MSMIICSINRVDIIKWNCRFPKFSLRKNLASSWLNSILIHIKLSIICLLNIFICLNCRWSSKIIILIPICLILSTLIQILLWYFPSNSMIISCCGSFIKLDIIQFDLSYIATWNVVAVFKLTIILYITTIVHLISCCCSIILNVHSITVFLSSWSNAWSTSCMLLTKCAISLISSYTHMELICLLTSSHLCVLYTSLRPGVSNRIKLIL